MTDDETGSPQSRLREAKKQLGIVLEDVDDSVVKLDIMVAAADVENAITALDREEVEA